MLDFLKSFSLKLPNRNDDRIDSNIMKRITEEEENFMIKIS